MTPLKTRSQILSYVYTSKIERVFNTFTRVIFDTFTPELYILTACALRVAIHLPSVALTDAAATRSDTGIITDRTLAR